MLLSRRLRSNARITVTVSVESRDDSLTVAKAAATKGVGEAAKVIGIIEGRTGWQKRRQPKGSVRHRRRRRASLADVESRPRRRRRHARPARPSGRPPRPGVRSPRRRVRARRLPDVGRERRRLLHWLLLHRPPPRQRRSRPSRVRRRCRFPDRHQVLLNSRNARLSARVVGGGRP